MTTETTKLKTDEGKRITWISVGKSYSCLCAYTRPHISTQIQIRSDLKSTSMREKGREKDTPNMDNDSRAKSIFFNLILFYLNRSVSTIFGWRIIH